MAPPPPPPPPDSITASSANDEGARVLTTLATSGLDRHLSIFVFTTLGCPPPPFLLGLERHFHTTLCVLRGFFWGGGRKKNDLL